MGNRVHIVVESERFPTPIYLYGHWSGEDGFNAVQRVLMRSDRIGDASYLTAQLFYCFAVELGSYVGTTGFGISSGSTDYAAETSWDDNPPIIVFADTGEVFYEGKQYTAEQFCSLGIGGVTMAIPKTPKPTKKTTGRATRLIDGRRK